MERKKLERAACRALENPELADAFREVAREESTGKQSRRVHLKRDPVWLQEYKWKKGQSGNPQGRPPVVRISPAVVNQLQEIEPETGRTYAELIALALVVKAMNGDVSAAREIREMSEGVLAQKFQIEGQISHTYNLQIENASDEQLEQIIQSYLETRYGNSNNSDNSSTGVPNGNGQ